MTDTKHVAMAVATHAPLERMHPVVAAAMAHSPDPATLRELLAVQREWEAGEQKKAFTAALVALKRDLPTVISRDKKVAFEGATKVAYSHASLAHILDEVTECLTAHGFSLAWEPRSVDKGQVEVTCRLTHAEGHSEACTLTSAPDTGGKKSPAQAIASTITLLERYTACALLGIATKDMEDDTRAVAPDAQIDPARNMKAAAWAAREGKSREDAEGYLGKPVSKWAADDLTALTSWVRGEERVPGAEG